MLRRLVGVIVIAVACCGAVKSKPPKIALFITVSERDGFFEIDRAIMDSLMDLDSAFDRVSQVRLVKARNEAEIVLTLRTRGVGGQAVGNTSVAVPLGKGVIASSTTVVQNDYWVSTVLEVGPTYRKEFVGKASNQKSTSMGGVVDLRPHGCQRRPVMDRREPGAARWAPRGEEPGQIRSTFGYERPRLIGRGK
jgi:hypothetical protein